MPNGSSNLRPKCEGLREIKNFRFEHEICHFLDDDAALTKGLLDILIHKKETGH